MTVTLAPRDEDEVNIYTGSEKKMESVMKMKTTLDKAFEENNIKREAEFEGLKYIDLYGYPIDTADLVKIDEDIAKKYRIGVFRQSKKQLYLATPQYNPKEQNVILQDLEERGYEVVIYLCSPESFDKLLRTYDYVVKKLDTSTGLEINEKHLNELMQQDLSTVGVQKLLENAENQTVSNLFEILLVAAYKNNASDIHIEPEKDMCVVRLRLDGVLHEFATIDQETQGKLESRIKILSNLKINVSNVPQDGRFTFVVEEKSIDVRVSMLPSNYGYSIVMRLLGTGNVALQLDKLGFLASAKIKVEKEMQKTHGMILTTGPTGSGKTTTLYTLLGELNDGESKIITLEDPVEYKLEGISQTQIDEKAGYTFAAGLRSIMRQDPDIVMVGEIRDEETAQIAIDASLTGHKVLSTIHTNDAVGALPRLLEFKVHGYAIADGLAIIIGQRLVRRVCEHCKYQYNLSEEEKNFVITNLNSLPKDHGYEIPKELVFYKSTGCENCNYTGFKGRLGIYEVLTLTDGVRKLLVAENISIVALKDAATSEGMVTMLQDGVVKATLGLTTIEEIQKNIQ